MCPPAATSWRRPWFYGSFHLRKVKTSCMNNFSQFCQVKYQCWQKESTMLKFFVFINRSKTTYIVSFIFSDSCFSAAQIAKISLLALIVASLDNHIFLHARCNRPFVFVIVWCMMHRQASRSQRWNSKTLPQLHESAFAVSYTILHKSAAV